MYLEPDSRIVHKYDILRRRSERFEIVDLPNPFRTVYTSYNGTNWALLDSDNLFLCGGFDGKYY